MYVALKATYITFITFITYSNLKVQKFALRIGFFKAQDARIAKTSVQHRIRRFNRDSGIGPGTDILVRKTVLAGAVPGGSAYVL